MQQPRDDQILDGRKIAGLGFQRLLVTKARIGQILHVIAEPRHLVLHREIAQSNPAPRH